MNKLLSSKVLALSMLALVAGESRGMELKVFITQNSAEQVERTRFNLPLSAKNQVLAKCSSEEQRKILSDLTDKQVHRIVFALWIKNKNLYLHKDITSGCIWDFLMRLSDVEVIIEHICQNKQDGDLSITSMRRQNPGLKSTRSGFCQFCHSEREKLHGLWNKATSPAWAWLKKLELLKRSPNELVNLFEPIIQSCNVSLVIPRSARRDKFVFANFLDKNWELIQPSMEQAMNAETQQPMQHIACLPFPNDGSTIPLQ